MTTGREALNRILKKTKLPYFSTSYDINDYRKDIQTVKKDLKASEIIKELFDFDFALRFPNNQPMLRIENKRTNEYWEIPMPKEEFELLKEVMFIKNLNC